MYIRTYTYVKLFGSSVAYLEMCKHIHNRNAIVCFLTNFIPNQSLDIRMYCHYYDVNQLKKLHTYICTIKLLCTYLCSKLLILYLHINVVNMQLYRMNTT